MEKPISDWGLGVLSKPAIMRHMEVGNIVIDPFEEKALANASVDVRLGNYFYRQNSMDHTQTLNPFYQKSIEKFYSEPLKAGKVSDYKSAKNPFYGLDESDEIILVSPGETILAHTLEFVGGKNGNNKKGIPAVTTEMRARSSIGRIGIGVCKCAGWGDVGYINRWTMEITNFSSVLVPLPVGLRIAQIIFHAVEPVRISDEYQTKGKYQSSEDLKELKKLWKPEDMLPKLYKDRDLGHFHEYY